MKFNMPHKPDDVPTEQRGVQVGDVYASKNQRKTFYWLVIAVNGNSAHCLGLDAEGQISTTASYGRHVFEQDSFNRKLLGRVEGLDCLNFDVIWEEQP